MTQPRSAGEGQSWARAGRSPLFPSTRLPPEGPTANRAGAVLCSKQAGGGLRSLKGGHLNQHQDRGEQGLQEGDLHLGSRPHSASVSCMTSDDPGGLPSELPGPAALRVKPSWPASIWWAPGTPLGSSLMWPNCFQFWGCRMWPGFSGLRLHPPPVEWGCTVLASGVVGGRESGGQCWGQALGVKGHGGAAMPCPSCSLPAAPRCPSQTLNIRPEPYMVTGEPGPPLTFGASSQALLFGTASQPTSAGQGTW